MKTLLENLRAEFKKAIDEKFDRLVNLAEPLGITEAAERLGITEAAERLLGLDDDHPERWSLGGNSDGFWYDMTSGGRFKWREILDAESIERVEIALKILEDLEGIYDDFTPEF